MLGLPKAIFAGLLIGGIGVTLCFLRPVYDFEESVGLGLLFKLRGIRTPPAEVAIVSIDKESAEQLNVSGNPSKWPRSLHAHLVEKLTRAGVRLIVFDVYFIEPRSAAEDDAFASALDKSRNVILAESVRARDLSTSSYPSPATIEYRVAKAVKPLEVFARAAAASAPFVLPRLPVRVSRYWTFQPGLGHMPTAPVVAFQLYTLPLYPEFHRLLQKASPAVARTVPPDPHRDIKTKGLPRFIKDLREAVSADQPASARIIEALHQSNLATTDAARYRLLKSLTELYYGNDHQYLNFYGPPRTINTIPFYRVLNSEKDTHPTRLNFRGKVVFVGLSENLLTEKEDSFYTVFSDARGVFLSGVEVLATAFANLIENSPVTPMQPHYYLLLVFSWGVLVGLICFSFGPFLSAAAVVGSGAIYLALARHLFSADGTWLPVAIPLFVQTPVGYLGIVLWGYVQVNRERRNIRKALGFYVPDDVVQELARNVLDLKKGDQAVEGICLHTDIAGYTKVSESLNPRDLSELMRAYLAATIEPVKRNGGLVIDLTGDSILAIWKTANLDTRRQACHAAVEMAKAVQQFNTASGSLRLPTRIGVHAGPIFLGNIGAADNYRYGARGDTVNTAARIESLNTQLGTGVLVSQEALQAVDGFLTREAGRFLLKGKSHPIVIHELLGTLANVTRSQKDICRSFSKGLEAFRSRSWDIAEEKFREAIEISHHERLSRFYLARCSDYQRNSPDVAWDDTIVLEEK